ncbi:iron-sulfur cluster assembly scaffold protein [Parasedimentitalea marina]|uniref:Iron-sulfur cluster assembly scaffold protein n=1 Tax=Parasedimentitalea marina TaxID=2483033 RepID=A0A3T0N2U4_9RHOB|nr:iron-sulfur cluster assembly scaffold protein [Parasedimentitalea marina]AZV78335.1 iron-sulfur cluster assembly scaffold protein [Parasedimentitalea marina]
MSSENDLIKLYSTRILALAADIPHLDRLEAPDATVKKRAPLCGSAITVDLRLSDGKIIDFGQDVKACALGQASASIVGAAILGRTFNEIETARNQLKSMLTNDGPVPAPPFEGLEVLIPARNFKNRHASILLALEATLEAMQQISQENYG